MNVVDNGFSLVFSFREYFEVIQCLFVLFSMCFALFNRCYSVLCIFWFATVFWHSVDVPDVCFRFQVASVFFRSHVVSISRFSVGFLND